MKKILPITFWICLISSSIAGSASAQRFESDNGGGTDTNSLIAAHFPDPDVIRPLIFFDSLIETQTEAK